MPVNRWNLFSRPHARPAVAAVIGAAGGAAYAHFIGCRTGTCPLTSSVWTASIYGAVVGALAGWPSRDRPGRAGTAGEERG